MTITADQIKRIEKDTARTLLNDIAFLMTKGTFNKSVCNEILAIREKTYTKLLNYFADLSETEKSQIIANHLTALINKAEREALAEKNKDEAEIAITDLSANRQQSKSVRSKSKKDKYRGRS